RHRYDPVCIATDEVSRGDDHAFEGDGRVDLARPVLIGPAMGDARGKDREAAGAEFGAVANGAINDNAAQLLVRGIGDHEFADNGIGQVTPGIDHDDIARLGKVECGVNHEV